jgi:hypothetical protein
MILSLGALTSEVTTLKNILNTKVPRKDLDELRLRVDNIGTFSQTLFKAVKDLDARVQELNKRVTNLEAPGV